MLIDSKQYSPVFKISRNGKNRQATQKIVGPGDKLSDLEILVREPNSRTLPNRKQCVTKMDKYLPRLESSEKIRSRNDIKRRTFNVNLTSQSPRSSSNTVHLPGIVSTTRKSSISDSTNTTSTSSIPSIEVTESEEELIVPFQRGNFFKTGQTSSSKSKNFESDCRMISVVPRPPRSPRPIESSLLASTKTFRNIRRNFKRSQHFELTLQNIEEVKDLEKDSPQFGQHSCTDSMILEREDVVDNPKMRQLMRQPRSHSTPVDYRDLRNKIDATRLVSMGDMSVEFTRHYLAGKGSEEGSEEDIRKRCISWLNSLSSSRP